MNEEVSMDQSFLDKMHEAIENNLGDEHFGVDELAHEVGVSRSQLHRKLHTLTGQSASQMIREYRLKKALEMLQKKVATVSEISYRVGFNSPSYFNTSFHEYFGYPPGEVKSRIPTDKNRKLSISKKPLVITLSILVLLALFYFSYRFTGRTITENKEPLIADKSIAVLPFKNLSKDQDNQYFVDGIMEDILNHLSGFKHLKTISRTSSERYRDISKSLPQIAEELGVSYVLEGSVQKYENKARIIVQLIDARDDKHVWSESFDRELSDIFDIQSEIAKKIASELSVALTLEEIEQTDKSYTPSLDTYYLYLLARFHWNKRTFEGYETSINYFEKAIKSDPEYGLAYAGLADTYNLMALQGPLEGRKNWRDKAVELALRALELDKRLAEAHNVLASIYTYYDWTWEAAEREYLMAIKLKPNYPTVHHYYSEHLSIVGRHREARTHINRALELDPLSFVIRHVSVKLYYHQRLFDEALAENQRCHELVNEHLWTSWYDFIINYRVGNNQDALEGFKNFARINGLFEPNDLDSIYLETGFGGLFNLTIDRTYSTYYKSVFYFKSVFYTLLGKNEKAIDMLEQNYNHGARNPEITFDINFKHLHHHPRFIALLKKLGLYRLMEKTNYPDS